MWLEVLLCHLSDGKCNSIFFYYTYNTIISLAETFSNIVHVNL